MKVVGVVIVCIVPVLISCGGAQPPAETPPSSAAPVAGVPWKDMNREQRLDHMKKVVFPRMKSEFSDFDPKFASMTCATCHGDGAKDGSFKMPNPQLPKLSAAGGFQKHMEKTPAITQFMMGKVLPDMASLLAEQPYDMKTKQGFACADCHTVEP